MIGKIRFDNLLMQLDPGGSYDNSIQSFTSTGFKLASKDYRKIGEAGCGLELDPFFREIMSRSLFRDICDVIYGKHTSISIYRAMIFNKPAQKGTNLPWHQDGGEWWALDRDPLCFIWIAIDPATVENGCVQVIRGSHKNGILSRRGHTLYDEDVEKYCRNENRINLVCQPGEAYLVHNWTIHQSGVNDSDIPRRALSFNYCDGRTKVLDPKPELAGLIGKPGESFDIIFHSRFK